MPPPWNVSRWGHTEGEGPGPHPLEAVPAVLGGWRPALAWVRLIPWFRGFRG